MRDRFLPAFIIVYLASRTTIAAFQPAPQLHASPRGGHHLHAAVSKSGSKPNKSSTVSPGFGSRSVSNSKTNSYAADSNKVRSLSGNTTPGAGSKILANAVHCFDRIRKIVGKEGTVDVYVRSPVNDASTFWFVGKVVRVLEQCCGSRDINDDEASSDKVKSSSSQSLSLTGAVYPTVNESIISQKRIILEYAKNELRPQNMAGPKYSKSLELWYAPGDSEMDVVRNAISLLPVIGSSKELREGFNVNDVGYNPEIYVGEENVKGGLRVVRDIDGRPIKPIFDITV